MKVSDLSGIFRCPVDTKTLKTDSGEDVEKDPYINGEKTVCSQTDPKTCSFEFLGHSHSVVIM